MFYNFVYINFLRNINWNKDPLKAKNTRKITFITEGVFNALLCSCH